MLFRSALASLLQRSGYAREPAPGVSSAAQSETSGRAGILSKLHFPAKAKRVIYLCMSGGPSHIDLFDYKPKLKELNGTELPATVRMGQRVTGMTSGQSSFPCAASIFKFDQHGKSGAWVSELFPHVATRVDDICFLKGMHGSNSRHGGALLELHTGSDTFIRPSMGSWISYGLGTENQDLPRDRKSTRLNSSH